MGAAARGFGWGRRIRTPATRARTWCPTPRRSPTKTDSATNDITGLAPRSADGRLERAARLETRHLRGRDRDFFSGARVAAVARGALVHAERAEPKALREPAILRYRLAIELVAAAVGHAHVGYDQVITACVDALEPRLAAGRDVDTPARVGEQGDHEVEHRRLVLHDERRAPVRRDRRW